MLHRILTIGIAGVWLVNGLWAKVLHGEPRHEAIVARILGEAHAPLFTTLIGVSEICMAGWIISRLYPRMCTGVQILVIGVMNTLEAILAPDLLLWGRWNALWAAIFMGAIFLTERLRLSAVRTQR